MNCVATPSTAGDNSYALTFEPGSGSRVEDGAHVIGSLFLCIISYTSAEATASLMA